MNLSKLFEIQAQLDNRIIESKELQDQDLLDKKILALQVELGELANEWRGFKFWSENQSPKPMSKVVNRLEHPLLVEYVDCLHFILSIGLELGYENKALNKWKAHRKSIVDQFSFLFWTVSELNNREKISEWDYVYMFGTFLKLGDMLGFTTEQIEQAYLEKNKENHRRQETGY